MKTSDFAKAGRVEQRIKLPKAYRGRKFWRLRRKLNAVNLYFRRMREQNRDGDYRPVCRECANSAILPGTEKHGGIIEQQEIRMNHYRKELTET